MTANQIDYMQAAEDYRRVEQAIRFLQADYRRQPELAEVAAQVHLSEYHFQRMFTRWVGISPKRFIQYLTKEHVTRQLQHSGDLLEAAFSAGLSGPGRLHDLLVTVEAVTPGEVKQRGAGLTIRYGFHPTPFGESLLAATDRGVCGFSFVQSGEAESALSELRSRWPRAEFIHDEPRTRALVGEIFDRFDGHLAGEAGSPLSLHLQGTNFQIKVWEALLRIPPGAVVTYADIAVAIGLPAAARAVGSAVGRNPIPVLIPCHRVIRKSGETGEYRWGRARKQALLGWEQAALERQVSL